MRKSTRDEAVMESSAGYSLVAGGPLFQLFRRSYLSTDGLGLVHRRELVFAAITWLPLLLLSLAAGHLWGKNVEITFLKDVESHVRFLIALPVLIAAELVVHRRIRPAIQQFVDRGIVRPEDLPKFQRAKEFTLRLRNSVMLELLLLAIVYTLGLWVWRHQVAQGEPSWYATPQGGQLQLTMAGHWYVFVSLPIFQFMLLRWYFRFFLWFMLLLRISFLKLRLLASHPDHAAGLGFLGPSTYAFAPVIFAQGAALAGLIASQIFFAGRTLTQYKVEIVSFLLLFVSLVLVPLLVFLPQLARARREGLGNFGRLANRYTTEFEEKWIHGKAPSGEPLLGSADIQSLADLGNSFGNVRESRLVPFGWKDVTRLAMIAAAPFLPLLLTVFSLDEFASYLISAVF